VSFKIQLGWNMEKSGKTKLARGTRLDPDETEQRKPRVKVYKEGTLATPAIPMKLGRAFEPMVPRATVSNHEWKRL